MKADQYVKKNDLSEYRRNESLKELRDRIFKILFLRQTLALEVGWLFCWGAAVLMLRVAGLVSWNHLLWGGIGIPVVPLIAFFLARKKIPNLRTLGATLDRENEAGGLIMSSFETNLESWNPTVEKISVPSVKWDGKKSGITTGIAALFVLLTFLLPDSSINAQQRRPMNIEDQLGRLKEQIETLKEENILEIETVEALKSNMERIQKEAEGLGPVKTLDALDHLNDQLRQKAEEAAEEGLKETDVLSRAEALSEQVQNMSDRFSPEEMKPLMDGLAEMLDEMLAENEQLFDELAEKLDDAGNDALKKMLEAKKFDQMTPEQLEQLRKAMSECKECNKKMLGKLCDKRMLDPSKLDQFGELAEIDEAELERLLAELGECEGCEGMCEGMNGEGTRPGRGGISRGRGDAPIRFDEKEASDEGTKFESKTLPPASLEELKNSLRFGSSRTTPQRNPDANDSSDQGGTLDASGKGTGSAHGQTILPQHRGPLGRYFERK